MATQTKKITIDTAALFTGRAVGLVLGFYRLNFLMAYLGIANFGVLNFAAYFTFFFQSLFDLGLPPVITRELARHPSRSNQLLGTTLVLKAVLAVGGSIVLGAAVAVSGFSADTNWALLLTTIALIINGFSTVFQSAFQAHRKMVLVSIISIANDAFLSGAIILLLPLFPNLTTALSLIAFVGLVNLGILIAVYVRTVGLPELHIDGAAWKILAREGAPIAVSSFGISTYVYIGPVILKYARGDVEVGIYSAGYKLISILLLIPTAFTQVVYPIFADFSANARQKLAKSLEDSMRVMAEVSIPLAVGTVLLAPRIIALVYNNPLVQSSDAPFVLQLLIGGNALGYLAWILQSFLLALDHQRFCMWNSVVIALLVLTANLLLVPVFGYAAVAT